MKAYPDSDRWFSIEHSRTTVIETSTSSNEVSCMAHGTERTVLWFLKGGILTAINSTSLLLTLPHPVAILSKPLGVQKVSSKRQVRRSQRIESMDSWQSKRQNIFEGKNGRGVNSQERKGIQTSDLSASSSKETKVRGQGLRTVTQITDLVLSETGAGGRHRSLSWGEGGLSDKVSVRISQLRLLMLIWERYT